MEGEGGRGELGSVWCCWGGGGAFSEERRGVEESKGAVVKQFLTVRGSSDLDLSS